MDFQLYSLGAALVFHEIFFPESSTAMALILAMGTYGAGYVARIVGAFIFGKMGDRIGRKKVLFITITMMGICTTLIGVLPTYAQIGVFAPILLVTLRIIQGLGAGAEISGAGTMLAEYAPKGKRGIISSFVAMGTNCGTLSATAIWAFMFFILSKEELLAWGWRIPFLASVVVMVFAIWLRMNLKESPVFEKVNDSNQPTAKPAPAGSMLVYCKSDGSVLVFISAWRESDRGEIFREVKKAMPPSAAFTHLVHAETNQVQRCQFLFTTFNNYGFSAADLLSGQTFSINRQDLASVTGAANHNTAASGDCVTVTIVGRHRCFLLSDLQSKPT